MFPKSVFIGNSEDKFDLAGFNLLEASIGRKRNPKFVRQLERFNSM